MRFVLPVVALVVAVVALAMAFSRGGGEQQSQGSDEVARLKVQVSALERRMADLRGGLDEVSAQLEDMRAAVPSRSRQPSQKPETSPSQPSATSPSSTAQPSLSAERLREIVKEEIQRYHRERRKRHEEPEEWEKKEFGRYAWIIYRVGNKLGLSKEQKRAYFEILKRFSKQVGEMWRKIRSEMRGASYAEIRKAGKERRKEILERARREVESLLDPQQRAKYRELLEKNDPLFRGVP